MEREKAIITHNNYKALEQAVASLLKVNFESIAFKQPMSGGGIIYLVEQYYYRTQSNLTLTVIINPMSETKAEVTVLGTGGYSTDSWGDMGSEANGMHKILYALSQEAAALNWQMEGVPERYLKPPFSIKGSLQKIAGFFGDKEE